MDGDWGISYEIDLRWMPLDLTDDKSTLVQVMAWCRQATSHYLSQCCPRSMLPNGVTRPQWVELFVLFKCYIKYKYIFMFLTTISAPGGLNHTLYTGCCSQYPVGRFNIKMPSYQHRDSHYKETTYLDNDNSWIDEMTSSYWICPLAAMSLQIVALF